ncbi:hypothetical protein BHE90_003963 [Fusarium euwallaceae]|uniref:Uncharacterized protein n=1 Tax=Fusarium euwallaceae TaxID=1147111 RepID=A0A430M0S0_9HYPO|nr:hypothetical protein BHE90_003963 [Fusarium euwallaceae]
MGIGELITEGLQFRAGASMLRISKTNVESLSNLIKIAKQGEMEEVLVRKTSINTASLAFVATVYLPATLLSAIFSSDLVVSDGGHFTIAPEFWKFVVILIPMTFITFGIMKSSQSFWARSHRKHVQSSSEKDKNGHV